MSKNKKHETKEKKTSSKKAGIQLVNFGKGKKEEQKPCDCGGQGIYCP